MTNRSSPHEHGLKQKTGDTTGRPNAFSSLLEDPNTKFSTKYQIGPQTETGSDKNGEGLWKLKPLMEIRTERGFPLRLEKASPSAAFSQFPQTQQQTITINLKSNSWRTAD